MDESISSIEELRRAQAAAQAQGSSIPDYQNWESILEDFDIAGVQSTGTYSGDVKLHQEVMAQVEEMVEEAKVQEQVQQVKPNNDEQLKTDDKTSQDKEQSVKANVVNSTSSTIMADYMKYYHFLS